MKGRSILLDTWNGREAAALMVDGRLEDFLVDTDAPRPGTIYRAIADRPVKGQGGMFLKTPDGPAFLRQIRGLAPGQSILVQVNGYAEPGKAVPVTQKLLFKSRYVIVTPDAPGLNVSRSIKDEAERDRILEIAHLAAKDAGVGLIMRSSCTGQSEEEIVQDVTAVIGLALDVVQDHGHETDVLSLGDGPHVLAWRDWTEPADVITEPGNFERQGVIESLERALTECAVLDSGAHAYVEPTRALVAIDVNTGRDVSLASGLKANIALARALPRLLRIKGLGGQIVIDPAPMAKKDRRAFETALRQSLRSDTVDTALVGWTPMGHYELQRKRSRSPLRSGMI